MTMMNTMMIVKCQKNCINYINSLVNDITVKNLDISDDDDDDKVLSFTEEEMQELEKQN